MSDIRYIGNLDSETDFLAAWRALHADSGSDPFLLPDWYIQAVRQFRHQGRPHITGVYASGALVGVVPLRARPAAIPAPRLRRLEHMLNHVADYTGNLFAAPHGDEFAAVLEALARNPGWDMIDYHDVPAASDFAAGLPRLACRWPILAVKQNLCPRIDITGTWDEFLDDHFENAKKRTHFRRRLRKLKRIDDAQLLNEYDLQAERMTFDDLRQIDCRGWKGAEGSALFASEPMGTFFRNTFRGLLTQDRLFVELLRAGERPIAYQIGFKDADAYYLYNTSFDAAYSRDRIGANVVYLAVKRAFDEQRRRCDLLRGASEYKNLVTRSAHQNYRVLIFRKPAFAAWYHACLNGKQQVKRIARKRAKGREWNGAIVRTEWDTRPDRCVRVSPAA